MSCETPSPVREPLNVPVSDPVARTCLVEEPSDAQVLTANRETDARTALKRGLAEYIGSLGPFTHPAGRTVEILESFDTWAEQEDKRQYPSAIVYSKTEGTYDASSFSPIVSPNCKVDDFTFVVKYSELEIDLTLDVVCTDPEERVAVAMQLEDALNPVLWRYGFILKLPHYHGIHGSYELLDNMMPDDEEKAFARNRHLVFTLRGHVPVVRLQTITPLNDIRVQVVVNDGNEPC